MFRFPKSWSSQCRRAFFLLLPCTISLCGLSMVSAAENNPKEPTALVNLDQNDRQMFRQCRDEVRSQAGIIGDLKSKSLVFEGVLGYLQGKEKLGLEERKAVQGENVLREKMFDLIGKSTGKPRAEIAATFARMAEIKGK